jgi:hypothetical protein
LSIFVSDFQQQTIGTFHFFYGTGATYVTLFTILNGIASFPHRFRPSSGQLPFLFSLVQLPSLFSLDDLPSWD